MEFSNSLSLYRLSVLLTRFWFVLSVAFCWILGNNPISLMFCFFLGDHCAYLLSFPFRVLLPPPLPFLEVRINLVNYGSGLLPLSCIRHILGGRIPVDVSSFIRNVITVYTEYYVCMNFDKALLRCVHFSFYILPSHPSIYIMTLINCPYLLRNELGTKMDWHKNSNDVKLSDIVSFLYERMYVSLDF